jgi:sec-independent protein translocase protein TatC
MNFWDHLEVLRTILLRSLFIIVTATIICFMLHKPILDFLSQPLSSISPNSSLIKYKSIQRIKIENPLSSSIVIPTPKSVENLSLTNAEYVTPTKIKLFSNGSISYDHFNSLHHLQTIGPLEGFTTTLKLSLWLGIVGSSPLWLLLFFSFIAPGLFPKEKKWSILFIGLVIFFSVIGMLFAFYVTLPLTNQFLFKFNSEISVNMWSLSQYIDYALFIMLSNGLCGSFFVFSLFLVHFQVISYQTMKSKRRYIILFIFILSALLTPPDVLTQCLLAFPLLIAYEFLIIYGKFKSKNKALIKAV